MGNDKITRIANELVITDLADENAALREAVRQLVDLVADESWDSQRWKMAFEIEYHARLRAEKQRDLAWARLRPAA